MYRSKLSNDERGIASIIVTMIMMIVITLIVVGFAQVARRNTTEALNRYLGVQAYYAAESGVNDVTRTVRNRVSAGQSINPKTDCRGSSGNAEYNTLNGTIDGSDPGVTYSCLLIDPNPKSLIYTSVRDGLSTVVPIDTYNNATLASLRLQWSSDGQAVAANNCNAGGLTLPTSNNWNCNYAILRVDLVKIENGNKTADVLNNGTTTFYLKPSTDNNPTPVAVGDGYDRAYIRRASCPTSGSRCEALINLTGSMRGGLYYVRLTGIYKDARNVTITGTDTAASVVSFENAQVLIDSTGKARDQLRRISVRVPIGVTNSNELPSNSLQTAGDICKRFTTGPAPLVTNTAQCQ